MVYDGYNTDRIEELLMRPDGKRVKDLPPIVAAIPYIMPKRYDAWNTITENIDEEGIKAYIREKRRAGIRINHMAVIIAAYYKAYQTNPKLNWFVVNSHLYERNHFCVSFVILKKRADGSPDETTLKIYLEPKDTIFPIKKKNLMKSLTALVLSVLMVLSLAACGAKPSDGGKDEDKDGYTVAIIKQMDHASLDEIADAIAVNSQTEQKNSTDKFAKMMFSIPGLPKFVIWLAYHLDKHGLLPRKIIDLSPFHTSMFITNLASIKTSYIHHHCYEFGTTSVFVCMGKPVPNYMNGDLTKKMMPLGIVMDERICTGYEYAAFCHDFRRCLRDLTCLETPFDGSAPAEMPQAEEAAPAEA